MKKTASLSVALLLFAVLPVSAATLEGTVQKIDPAKKEIVLNTEAGPETVEVTSATKGAEQVKVGDSVKVTYTKNGEKLVAIAIDASKPVAPVSPSNLPAASRERGGKSTMAGK
jgi:hypothetical protein